MNHLLVPHFTNILEDTEFSVLDPLLDQRERHAINQVPWPEFPYRPQVSFAIAHTGTSILLKYYVQEESIRLVHQADNSPVYEDSCVEFFLSFGDQGYYNLESNAMGVCLMGFGADRKDRELIATDILARIRRSSLITQRTGQGKKELSWQLTLILPLQLFVHHQITDLKNLHCRGNFYKCGDALPKKHFLAWNNVKAAEPDFHRPEYFGRIEFE